MKLLDMLQGIKNIIFDLGGVIYAIDYHSTILAFEALGINDFESVYAKAGQSNLFDDIETGAISKDKFVSDLKKMMDGIATEEQIIDAWNAMLIDFMEDAIDCLKRLKGSHRIFLLSNTNEIHIQEIEKRAGKKHFEDFCQLFEKVYLSHEIGMRKPHPEVFQYIINEQSLSEEETLFIDDSPQHVKGAIETGLRAHHLKENEKIAELLA